MVNSVLRHQLVRLQNREDLTRDEAAELLVAMLADDASDVQIAATLVALSAKGETVDELSGLAEELRERAVRVNSGHEVFVLVPRARARALRKLSMSQRRPHL